MAKKKSDDPKKPTRSTSEQSDAVGVPVGGAPDPADKDTKMPVGTSLGFFSKVLDVLPKIKTRLQVAGLIVAIAGFAATRAVPHEYVIGCIAAGLVGVCLLIDGLAANTFPKSP